MVPLLKAGGRRPIRDHAIKQENEHLGLPDRPQAGDDKVEKFGEWLWRQRSREGRTVLELLNYVVLGNGTAPERDPQRRLGNSAHWSEQPRGNRRLGST